MERAGAFDPARSFRTDPLRSLACSVSPRSSMATNFSILRARFRFSRGTDAVEHGVTVRSGYGGEEPRRLWICIERSLQIRRHSRPAGRGIIDRFFSMSRSVAGWIGIDGVDSNGRLISVASCTQLSPRASLWASSSAWNARMSNCFTGMIPAFIE